MKPIDDGVTDLLRFRDAYARHRAAEGRGAGGVREITELPYVTSGPHAAAWRVRARSYERFVSHILEPLASETGRSLRVLDLGAGNGWLSRRLRIAGHDAVALDIRDDAVDGLGAAAPVAHDPEHGFHRTVASFEALPLAPATFDIALFNASLHYALHLRVALGEAARVTRGGGRIVILDSPFYTAEEDGAAMVAEKHAAASARFGEDADALLVLPCIEYLTRPRLERASAGLRIGWRRHRVLYPLRYEARPVIATLLGRRPPSRFDVWEGLVG